jgi:hypothetical protein
VCNEVPHGTAELMGVLKNILHFHEKHNDTIYLVGLSELHALSDPKLHVIALHTLHSHSIFSNSVGFVKQEMRRTVVQLFVQKSVSTNMSFRKVYFIVITLFKNTCIFNKMSANMLGYTLLSCLNLSA